MLVGESRDCGGATGDERDSVVVWRRAVANTGAHRRPDQSARPALVGGKRRRGVRVTYLLPFGYPIFRSGLGHGARDWLRADGQELAYEVAEEGDNASETAVRHRPRPVRPRPWSARCCSRLTMFVALVVNVGQMVNRRVALQLVADAGAWTGATVQAVQLNHYAFWSRQVQNAYKNASVSQPAVHGQRMLVGRGGRRHVRVRAERHGCGRFSTSRARPIGKPIVTASSTSTICFPANATTSSFSTMAGPDDGMVGRTARRQHFSGAADEGRQALHRRPCLEPRDDRANGDRARV